MSPEERLREHVARTVASFPPLTDAQRARITTLMRGTQPGQNPPPEPSKRAQRTSTPRKAGSRSDRRPAAVGGGRT